MAGMHRSPYQGFRWSSCSIGNMCRGMIFGMWTGRCLQDGQGLSQAVSGRDEPASDLRGGCERVDGVWIGGDEENVWSKYDHATAIAASLSYLAIQQQDSVGLAILIMSCGDI